MNFYTNQLNSTIPASKFKPDVDLFDATSEFFKSGVRNGITQKATRSFNKYNAKHNSEGSRMISADEANKHFPVNKEWESDVPYELAKLQHEIYRDEQLDGEFANAALQKPSNYGAMVLGSLAGSVLDPIEAGAAYLSGGLATTRFMTGAFKGMSPAARTIARGAAFGIGESAAMEVPYYMLSKYNDEKYTVVDSMVNLTFGGVMSTGGAKLRTMLGDYDIDLDLKESTIKDIYNLAFNNTITGQNGSASKVLASDMNVIRKTHKDAIDAIVAEKVKEFDTEPTEFQLQTLRDDAELQVYREVNNSINKQLATAKSVEPDTKAEQAPEASNENGASEVLSRESDVDNELKEAGVEFDEPEPATDITPKVETETKKPEVKEVDTEVDQDAVIMQRERDTEAAFTETVGTFFEGVQVVNVNKATELSPGVKADIESNPDFDAFYNPEDGRIYFDPSKINKDNVGKIILHEVIGHKGLEGMLSAKEWKTLYKYIDSNYKEEVDVLSKELGVDREIAIKEIIAESSESGVHTPDYMNYAIAKAKNMIGLKQGTPKALGDAVVQEMLYRSMRYSQSNKLAKAATMGRLSPIEREEVRASIQRQKELNIQRENAWKIQDALDAQLNKVDTQIEGVDVKVRGINSRDQFDLKYGNRIDELRKQRDLQLEEIEYNLEMAKRKPEADRARAIAEARARGAKKRIEFDKKLKKIKDQNLKDQAEIKGIASRRRAATDKKIESINQKIADLEAKIRGLKSREAIEARLASVKGRSIDEIEGIKVEAGTSPSDKIKAQMEAEAEIQIRKAEKLRAEASDIIKYNQLKKQYENNESLIHDNINEELEEEIIKSKVLRRRTNPEEQKERDAADAFVGAIPSIDQKKKNRAKRNTLTEYSDDEIKDIDNITSSMSAIINNMPGSPKEIQRKMKNLIAKSNMLKRVRLYDTLMDIPMDSRMSFLDDLVENKIPAQISYTLTHHMTSFNNAMNKVYPGYNKPDAWKEATRAAYFAKDPVRYPKKPSDIGQKLYEEYTLMMDNIFAELRGVGGYHNRIKEHMGSHGWDIDKMAKEFGISVEHFDIKSLKTISNDSDKNLLIHKMYEAMNDRLDWDLMAKNNDFFKNKVNVKDTDEAKFFFKSFIEGLWDGKRQDYTDTHKSKFGSAGVAGESRSIHFIDADSAFDMQAKFGVEEKMASIMDQAQDIITKTVLIDNLGFSYGHNLDKVIGAVAESTKQGSRQFQKGVKKSKENLQYSLGIIDGSAKSLNKSNLARILQNLRSISVISKMGNLWFTSQSDVIYTKAALQKFDIKSEKINDFMKLASRSKTAGEQFMAEQSMASIDAIRSSTISRFNPNEVDMNKMLAKMQHGLFKISGMNWHNRTMREGFENGAARRLGVASKYSMAELRAMGDDAKSLVSTIEANGITDLEWTAISNASVTPFQKSNGDWDFKKSASNDAYITPQAADLISDSDIINILKSKGIKNPRPTRISAERNALRRKLGGMIRDEMDNGILTPGVREWRQLNLNTLEGSWQNAVVKTLFQFKSFPLAMINKVIKPALREKGLAGLLPLASLAAQATMVSVIFAQMKDVVEGKTVRPWDDPLLWIDGLSRSGGLAFLADVGLKDYTGYGLNGDLRSNLGGPAIGLTGDFLGIGQQFIKDMASGDFEKSGKKFAQFADSWMPYGTFVPIKHAKQQLISYPLYEAFSPNALEKKEKWIEDNMGQEHWLTSPTGNIPKLTWGDILLRFEEE